MALFFIVCGCSTVVHADDVAPPCDTSRSGAEVCDDFCNSRCGFYNTSLGDDGRPKNVTLYRLTPKNVTGIQNKDTGDAAGDITFYLEKKNLTRECALHPTSFGCFLDGDNIYGEFVVEMSTQFGPYFDCLPVNHYAGGITDKAAWVDTRKFDCGQACLWPNATGCHGWGGRPVQHINGSAQEDHGISCWCDGTARHNKTVGREPPDSLSDDLVGPKWWPKQCSLGFEVKSPSHCISGEAYKHLQFWSTESVLAGACNACAMDDQCEGWATHDNRTAILFKGPVIPSNASCIGGAKYHSDWGGSWGSAGDVGGRWYSTPISAECKNGAPLGTDGCSWRVVNEVYKNARCVDRLLDGAVELYGKVCFDTCEQPLNRTVVSDCYLFCYRNTLIGDASYNLTAMPRDLIIKSWTKGFEEDDPEAGGCSPVQPAACEGPQCGRPSSMSAKTLLV